MKSKLKALALDLRTIADDAPDPRGEASLSDWQRRLDGFDERMSRVIAVAKDIEGVAGEAAEAPAVNAALLEALEGARGTLAVLEGEFSTCVRNIGDVIAKAKGGTS